jgi:hypothetical protein
MTAPAGVSRLMDFVDARLAQLQLSKQQAAQRGFPSPSTLAKVRDSDDQTTPTVRTLLRIDRALGWQPGSAAVTMLGGNPLSVTARTTGNAKARAEATQPMTAEEVVHRLLAQLRDEITRTRRQVSGLGEHVDRLAAVHDRLAAEFNISESLVKQFMADEGLEDL